VNIAIIPARSGSRRIPGKNTRLFHGKPIMAYSIENAMQSGVIDKVYVSTEGLKEAEVARRYGASIHNRPKALADDDVGTQAVMRSAINWWISCHGGARPEYVCCLYATAPLLTPRIVSAGLDLLQGAKWASYLYTVDVEDQDIGGMYWGRAQAFLDGVPLQGNSYLMRISRERCCDINVEEDWQRAERMFKALKNHNAEYGNTLNDLSEPMRTELLHGGWKT
jgi:N-acylneuraminate cytidylyltransferase